MKRHGLARFAYRMLLRLHPAPFRGRFAEEMLWIFDRNPARGQAGRLLYDGVLSLIRQHAASDHYEESLPPQFGVEIATSGISALRLAQAGTIAMVLLLGSSWVVGRGMPSLQQIHRFDSTHAKQHVSLFHRPEVAPRE